MSEIVAYCFLFVVLQLYHILGAVFVFMRSDSIYIQKRDWKPLLVLSIVNIVSTSIGLIQLAPLFGIKLITDCRAYVFTLPICIFAFFVIYMMRCISLFKLYYYNQTKSGGGKRLDKFEKVLLTKYMKKKESQSSLASGFSGSVVFSVSKESNGWLRGLGIPFGVMFLGACFGAAYGGFQCKSTLPIVFVMVVLYTIMTFTFFVILRKVRDPYYVKFEMLTCSVIFIVLILASGAHYGALSGVTDPAKLSVPNIYSLLSALTSATVGFWMPVYLSYKKTPGKSTTVKKIMQSKEEWAEFTKICAEYFVLENILFIQQFTTVKLNPTKESLQMLYNEFIANGSPNELNISGTTRTAIKAAIQGTSDNLVDLFMKVENQVVKNLEENIVKYYVSE